ncbi:MAG: winged helix-turn-helix domain-containing protein [Alphaproteobacteria bacterium]|jgi:DNA-binding response OmpR family regulator|nr:winged helix-turn-helix transcriptional regulator [Thalassospira sp.]MCE2965810.1 winged helix-turn-helix domain-containing protein [Alphaproteobacteria bacterium]
MPHAALFTRALSELAEQLPLPALHLNAAGNAALMEDGTALPLPLSLAALRHVTVAALPLHPFMLDTAARKLLEPITRNQIDLTEKETLLLSTLRRAGDDGLPRTEITSMVLGYAADTDSHALDNLLYRLRQKLETLHSGASAFIESDNGITRWCGGA